MAVTAYQQISANKRRSIGLILVFVVFVCVVGYFFGEYYGTGGYTGLYIAALISFFMTLTSIFAGDKLALASSGAQEIQKEDNPYVWRLVENVAMTAGLPMPRVYIIPDNGMNAFATGRNPEHASIALTAGIIDALENEELEAVIAHELSHIKNYDTRLLMIVVVLVGIISLLSNWVLRSQLWGGDRRRNNNNRGGGQLELILALVGIVFIILSPIIAELIKLAISRKREYLADASAVLLTRYAQGLASALEKIAAQEDHGRLQRANQATAHLFFVNPFGGTRKWLTNVFSTHPPIEDRIARLRQMS
ncbi:MAG: zinc metalloprotease HtpX [Candidatus Kerfeldbacteria bacterium]|nr:zinc metalloprotease HtpX [Candidatus Kerfeldbacteria bacterium]